MGKWTRLSLDQWQLSFGKKVRCQVDRSDTSPRCEAEKWEPCFHKEFTTVPILPLQDQIECILWVRFLDRGKLSGSSYLQLGSFVLFIWALLCGWHMRVVGYFPDSWISRIGWTHQKPWQLIFRDGLNHVRASPEFDIHLFVEFDVTGKIEKVGLQWSFPPWRILLLTS